MNFKLAMYKLRLNMFNWIQDDDGDVGVQLLFGLITLVKYKEHTVLHWFKGLNSFRSAGKWQGHVE